MEIEKYNALGIDLKGKTSGEVRSICPLCSHNRKNKNDKCLAVNVSTGQYFCHHCNAKGSIHSYKKTEKKIYKKPVFTNKTNLSDLVVKWFEGRKISQTTLIKAQITESIEFMPQIDNFAKCINFNYFRDNELINIKYRDRNKNFKLFSGAELIFYGLDFIKDSNFVIIVEGEIDALTWYEAGIYECVSVPNGAQINLQYLDNCIEHFENKEVIYLATDQDEKGIILENELRRRLGSERCKKINFDDCKDSNEYACKYGFERLRIQFENAITYPIDGVINAIDSVDNLNILYEYGLQKGATIGINAIDEKISFETGRLAVVTGIPSHGKSEFIDFIVCRLLMKYGWRPAYFTPENYPLQYHVSKLLEKISGFTFKKGIMPEFVYRKTLDFINENIKYIFPDNEEFSIDNILDVAKILVKTHGIKMLIIDPYNRLEHQIPKGLTETQYISGFLSKLLNFSQKNDVLTFLIAHPRKMLNKNGTIERPNLYDISGSANFYNKTDYGFIIHRNFGQNFSTLDVQKVKFKHLGCIGEVNLRYNTNNGRYSYLDDCVNYDNSNWLENMPCDNNDNEYNFNNQIELPF